MAGRASRSLTSRIQRRESHGHPPPPPLADDRGIAREVGCARVRGIRPPIPRQHPPQHIRATVARSPRTRYGLRAWPALSDDRPAARSRSLPARRPAGPPARPPARAPPTAWRRVPAAGPLRFPRRLRGLAARRAARWAAGRRAVAGRRWGRQRPSRDREKLRLGLSPPQVLVGPHARAV